MSAHLKAQLVRGLRLVVVALLAQPVVAALVSSTAVRYPLVGAIVAVVEVLVRQVFRVKTIDTVTAVLADPPPTTDPAPPTAKG